MRILELTGIKSHNFAPSVKKLRTASIVQLINLDFRPINALIINDL